MTIIPKDLPTDWRTVTVEAVGSLFRGISYKKVQASNTPKKGYLPILRANNINRGLNFDDLVYVPSSLIGPDQYIREGDIVFAMSSGSKHLVGKSARANSEFAGSFGAFCGLFRPDLEVNNSYVAYFFQSPFYKQVIRQISKGTNINNLKREHILDLEMPLAPLPVQERIVTKLEELFSELDAGVESLKKAQAQLKTYRQSVLKWAFEGRLTNLKLSNGKLPEGWKLGRLGEETVNLDGKRIPLSRAVRSARQGPYRYYGATEIVDHIDDFIFDGKYLLIGEDGANLLSKSRPLAFIVEGQFWVNNHAHILQTKESLNVDFLCHYFNSLNLHQYVTGSAQPKLTQANLNKIPVPICSISEQRKVVQEIDRRLSVCNKLEEAIEKELNQSEALRQSILKRAFEGNLV